MVALIGQPVIIFRAFVAELRDLAQSGGLVAVFLRPPPELVGEIRALRAHRFESSTSSS
jgi:hypothetical protein